MEDKLPKFEVRYLKDVTEFLNQVPVKVRTKILRNVDVARFRNDPKLLKKITSHIWEFRTSFEGNEYRLLGFFDTFSTSGRFIVLTHGFGKKTQKTPKSEIEKAEKIRKKYIESA